MMPCQCLYQATCPQLHGARQVQGWLDGPLQEPRDEICVEILTMAETWEIPVCGVARHPIFVPHVTVGIYTEEEILNFQWYIPKHTTLLNNLTRNLQPFKLHNFNRCVLVLLAPL